MMEEETGTARLLSGGLVNSATQICFVSAPALQRLTSSYPVCFINLYHKAPG